MTIYVLDGPERILFDAIRNGVPAKFKTDEPREIRACILRHIILGLPVEEEGEGILLKAASLLGLSPPQACCRITGVGISIENAIIKERLILDSVVGEAGGSVVPLEFSKCRFEGGFSGRHAHFSRLGFEGCWFRDPPPGDEAESAPSLDLSGAAIGSNLSMRGVKPWREPGHPDGHVDRLWIRAIGARIDGEVDLSYSRLRSPAELRDRPLSEPPICALDLSLARISGDVQFLNGAHSEGAIYARGAVIRGDVWMSGAFIDGGGKYALFFQSAEIGGLLMLDGRSEDAGRRGDCEPFRAFGQLNLNDLQLGGSLILANVRLLPPRAGGSGGSGPAEAADPAVEPDESSDPADFACLRLDDARIGDSVLIAIDSGERSRLQGLLYLANLEVKNALTICDAYLGVPVAARREDEPAVVHAPFLTARQVTIANVEPLLWEEGDLVGRPDMMTLSVNLEGARVESLKVVDSWLNGHFSAVGLKCAGDVTLDARIGVIVRLNGAEIGGSLDISELRLDEKAKGLMLRDATIARALRLTQADSIVREDMRLVAARRAELASLAPMILMECLWRCASAGGRSPFLQTRFLFNGDRAFLLDGKQATFDSIVGHFGNCIVKPAAADDAPPLTEAERENEEGAERARAIEFVRLYCACVRSDDSPRIMITRRSDRPPFLRPVPAADAADRPPVQGPPEFFAGIESAQLEPKAVASPDGGFVIGCLCLKGDALVSSRFRLRAAADPVKIKLLEDRKVGAFEQAPVADGPFLCHPAGIDAGLGETWIMPPAAEDMQAVADKDLAELEAKLVHHVRSSCAIHGTADLTGLVCGMLDDNSGRAWGAEALIPMNHFVYSRTTWIGRDAQDPASFHKGMWRSIRVEAARKLPLWLIRLLGLNARLRRSSRYCSGWQARLNWIYRQFRTQHLPFPSRYPITQANYAPQPFEQAIRVCRAEGREDYAIQFEIVKQKIEWRLFNRRNWARFVIIGLLAALVWLFSTDAGTPDRPLVAAVLAAGIAAISYIASFALRIMFGYLRKPVRAIGSLVTAFLIGWGGVHIANDRHLLVVDVEPVAGLVEAAGDRFLMASQNAGDTDSPVHHVHCGESISEALYALDVLIPLIDLREESRCEVARANDYRSDRAFHPGWASWLGPAADSERFWSAAKAIYAIAGWFIVSLSILTFAQVNRTRVEPN